MLWFDTADIMHYPPFVDKTLKLFNLKQVAHEIETSVMSKVSCTACKAGLSMEQFKCNLTKEIVRWQCCPETVNYKFSKSRARGCLCARVKTLTHWHHCVFFVNETM